MRGPPPILLGVFLLCLGSACAERDCAACRDEKCADLVSQCAADDGCQCLSDCLGSEGIPGVGKCLETCGLETRPTAFLPVEECVARACPDSDECLTPEGYEAPTPTVSTTTDERIGGGTEADCGFDPALPFDPEGSVLQLESPDGLACVRLERRNDGVGDLANTNFTLVDARIGTLGRVSHVTGPTNLCWYSSHHNFGDVAHVWTGTRHHDVTLEEDGHGGPRTYALYTFEAGPLDGQCAPTPQGTTSIGDPLALLPFTP